MNNLDPRALRNAFGTFMTGVTVVTGRSKEGGPIGFTANSFTSVSLDPPMLLVCVAKTSSNYDALVNGAGFAVNILAQSQVEISNTFARPVTDRFAGVEWRDGPFGSPILGGVSAWFDCSLHSTVEAGDHVILLGRVEAFDQNTTPGLGYARGAYVTPETEAQALGNSTNLIVSALIERNNQVLLVDDGHGGLGLPEAIVGDEGASATVKRLIETTGLTAKPGFIYSVFEDVARKRQHISFLCQAAKGEPRIGRFVGLAPRAPDAVTDPAIAAMLERFAVENAGGMFGIYHGDQNSGEVRPMTQGS